MNWKAGTKVTDDDKFHPNYGNVGTIVKEMNDNECYGIQWNGSSYTDGDFSIEWSGDLQLITKLEQALI